MKQQMNKVIFWTVVCSLASLSSGAQQLDGTTADQKMLNGAPGTGAMSNLYNLNLYDGSATINIPIYSYSTDEGDFGVSFSYNTKGVKVDEQASRIGLHWMLNAGGSIQRVVRDLPDELAIETNYQPDGYTPFSEMVGRYAASFPPANPALPKRYLDKESDDFIVNVGNLNFTFQIGRQRAIHTIPEKNVKIEVLSNGVLVEDYVQNHEEYLDYNTFEFRITDEAGNQYYFINGDRKTNRFYGEYYQDQPMLSMMITNLYKTTMSWVIKEVILNTGAKIVYNYHAPTLSSGEYLYNSFQVLEGGSSGGELVKGNEEYIVLKDIDYPNGVNVAFVHDTAGRCDAYYSSSYHYNALREVVVKEQGNCLRYLLQQSYFTTPYSGHPEKEIPYGAPCRTGGGASQPSGGFSSSQTAHRLKLNGIKISDCSKNYQEPYYAFVYDTLAVPARFGGGQDYFGYYNGKKATVFNAPVSDTVRYRYEQSMNIPYHKNSKSPFQNYGLDKSADINKMKMGILKQVTNAQGGTMSFDYEGHGHLDNITAGFTLPVDSFFGINANDGLRLKSITEQDAYHPGAFTKTSFTYEQGQRFLTGGYFHYPSRMAAATGDLAENIIFGDYYLTAHHLVAGSNHGYGKVTVSTTNEGSELLSKREYTFTNYSDASSGNQARYLKSNGSKHYFEFPYTDKQYLRDWEMGLPLTITDYDQNNRIVQKAINTYSFHLDTTASLTALVTNQKVARLEYVGAPIVDTFRPEWNDPGASYNIPDKRSITDSYRPYRGKSLLEQSVVLRYVTDNQYIADTSWYSYDSRNNVKDIITQNSDGSKVRTRNVYNYDAPASSGSELYQMNQAGVEKLVSTERWLVGTGAHNTDKLLDAGLYSFKYLNGKIWSKNLYTLAIGSPLTYSAYTGITGGPGIPDPHQKVISAFNGSSITHLRKVSEVSLFDTKGNPLENKMLGQEQYRAMIWDTTAGNKKLAEVENARYTDIAYNSFEYNGPGPGGNLLVQRGNTSYNSVQAIEPGQVGGVTGRYVYKMESNGGQSISGTQNLAAGKEYLLSFWAKGSMPKVYIGNNLLTPGDPLCTREGWGHYIIRFTPALAATFKIDKPASGTAYIDEVRLFPADALMQSQTYEPLFGISSTTDATGRVTCYEYDALGRQTLVRDQEGRILIRKRNVVQGPQY